MADDNKYYWIKLHKDFFGLDEIEFLRDQPNGCEYIVLYQMLCLKTANNGGLLTRTIGDMVIPYTLEKMAKDTGFSIDTVRVAMNLYQSLRLIVQPEDGGWKIANMENMVGSETKWAEKKRKQRGLSGDNVPQLSAPKEDIVPCASSDIGDNVPAVSPDMSSNNEDIVRQEIELEIDIPPISPKGEIDALFEEFWAAYPKHVGKAPAEKAFAKHKPDRALLTRMLDALRWQRESEKWRKDGGQYVPNPATWLNQQRWEDECPAELAHVAKASPAKQTQRYETVMIDGKRVARLANEPVRN